MSGRWVFPAESDTACLGTERSHGCTDNCHDGRCDGERQPVIIAERNSERGLDGRVLRGKQIAQLISKAGKCSAHRMGRKFVQMNWNNAPRPLDKELDQKGAKAKQHDIV